MTRIGISNNNPVVTLKAKAQELDFSKLRADKGNKLANSGETMYLDFERMNFIINGKEIDKNFITILKEGARKQESKLFNSDAIHNTFNQKKPREIDTDHGQAFVPSVLKDLEKELAKDAFSDIWEEHCKNSETTDDQKTPSYHIRKNLKDFTILAKSIFIYYQQRKVKTRITVHLRKKFLRKYSDMNIQICCSRSSK